VSLRPAQGTFFGSESTLPPEQAWLTPMPRIKLFSEGDQIKFNSPILLECGKDSGSGNSGGANLRLHLAPDEDVVCASKTRGTTIRMRLFASYAQSQSGSDSLNVLKGGDFIRLFHQEHEALLEVARHAFKGQSGSSAAPSVQDFISDEITLCLRSLPEGVEPEAAHSASSLWQVELQGGCAF